MRLLDPEKRWNSTTLRDKVRVGMRKGNKKKEECKIQQRTCEKTLLSFLDPGVDIISWEYATLANFYLQY